MNDVCFVIGTLPPWPHSDDNMLYHAPRRADQPLPCTTNTASYAHSPQYPTTTPASSMLLHAVRTNHGNSNTPPTTPDTQFASPTIVLLPLEFSTGLWDDRRLFSKMHSAYGLNFEFWKRNLGFGYNCHAIHFTRFTNNTLFPQPLFSLLQRCGFVSLAGVTSPRTGYHRDGMARVVNVLFRSVIFYNPLT
jgi:hypothetical protein